jgi:hypothetical protein
MTAVVNGNTAVEALVLVVVAVVVVLIARRQKRKVDEGSRQWVKEKDLEQQWVGEHRGHPGFSSEQIERWKAAGYNAQDARRISRQSGDLDNPPPR